MDADRSKGYRLVADLLQFLRDLEWHPILLVRVAVGVLFFESGRGKLFVKLEELGNYFVELGIPFPHLNAFVTASIEFVGGACLVIGFATRLFSAPLAFIMLVALLTAQLKTVNTVGDFLYLPEVLLLVIFVWLVFSGPGKVSIDHHIARRFGLQEP